MQKMNDDQLAVCKSCGGELKKLITNTSFVLKGGGWYVTDYPSKDRKKAMDKKTAPASKESKPATKPESKKKAVNA